MKYLKTFEDNSKIEFNATVAYFPKGDKKDMKGTWTTFWGIIPDIRKQKQDFINIIWQKYFQKDDPCENSDLGPCRPEYKEYPKELIDTFVFFKDDPHTIEFEKYKEKKYWNNWDGLEWKYPLPDLDEVTIKLEFISESDFYNWLDNFRFILNNGKENYNEYITSKKFNL